MEPLKPSTKKSNVISSQRPPSIKKDTLPLNRPPDVPTSTSNPFGFMEISGAKITKQSAMRKPNVNMSNSNTIRRSSIKGGMNINRAPVDSYNDNDESEESKSNYIRDDDASEYRQSLESLNSTLRSQESNLYVDDYDANDEGEDKLRRRQDFNAFMKQEVEENEAIKRVYANHFLDQKRREHDEEEELKYQTSKPFQKSRGKMNSSSYKQQSVAATSNAGSQQYEKSTEYGDSASGANEEGEVESDIIGDPFSRSFTDSSSSKGQLGPKKIRSAVQGAPQATGAAASLAKPFKISDLKRNSSRTDTTKSTTEPEKKRVHLSLKEKKRLESEEAILKKSKKAANVWKINPDPVDLRQMRAAAQHIDERRFREMEIIQDQVREMERRMSKKNKMKFKALVEGSTDIQDLQENGSVMTEFDVVLAEREARQYQIERERRFNDLKEMVEESVDDLSELSAQEIRQRALFITDFGKKKSQRKPQEDKKEKDNLSVSDVGDSAAADFEDSDASIMNNQQQNAGPNGNGTFFIERNIENAFRSLNEQAEQGLVSRVPEQARVRLENLLEGVDDFNQRREEDRLLADGNPYEPTEEEIQELIELQKNLEALKMDDEQIQNLLGHELFSLKNAILPKDQSLKEEAEKKILREKMNSVNDRLKELYEGEKRKGEEGQSKVGSKVEKIKIKHLVNQLVETERVSTTPQLAQELENLAVEFSEHARLLEESRTIITRLTASNIEQEIGEFRQLLAEATAAQIRFEEEAEFAATKAVIEEQEEIMAGFRSRFDEINSVQEDILQRESAFMQVVKDNQLEGVLGIQFTEREDGQAATNNDYEVEDIAKLQEDAMKKLQEEIDAQIEKINQKYTEFSEDQIDDKIKEMEEIDRQIEANIMNQNPDALELLRQSVIQKQEEEDREILRRSQVTRPKTRIRDHSNDENGTEQAKQDLLEDKLIEEITQINGTIAPFVQGERMYRTDLSSSYYEKKKEIEENLKIIEEIKNKQQLINKLDLDDEDLTTTSTSKLDNKDESTNHEIQSNQECQFEDSLEM